MKAFHLTRAANARSIVADGFRDSTGQFMTAGSHSGVWISDRPLIIESGIDVEDIACFEIEIPEEIVAHFEWIEERKGYREWLVPSELLNSKGSRRLLTWDQLEEIPW